MRGKQNIFSVFYFFIIAFPLVDIINGILIYYDHDLSIGMLFRSIFILFLFISCIYSGMNRNFLTILVLLSSIGFLSIIIIQQLYLKLSIQMFVEELGIIFRYFLYLWIPLFLSYYEEYLSKEFFYQLFFKLDIIFTLGLLIPYALRIGNYTYDGSAGFKGFYFATNDITFAFLILLFFLGKYFLDEEAHSFKSSTIKIVFYLLNIYCLLIIGTKTGLFFGLVYTCAVVIQYLFSKKKSSLNVRFIGVEVLLVAILLLISKGRELVTKLLSGVFRRFRYFYELYGGDLFRVITSSRNVYLEDAYQQFVDYPENAFALLFGLGFTNRWALFGRKGGLIEMDIFDTFFSYGLIGLGFLCITILFFLKKSQGFSRKIILFAIFYSIVVGHVFYSALSASILGLVFGLALYENRVSD